MPVEPRCFLRWRFFPTTAKLFQSAGNVITGQFDAVRRCQRLKDSRGHFRYGEEVPRDLDPAIMISDFLWIGAIQKTAGRVREIHPDLELFISFEIRFDFNAPLFGTNGLVCTRPSEVVALCTPARYS
jgi:hypothetical protein